MEIIRSFVFDSNALPANTVNAIKSLDVQIVCDAFWLVDVELANQEPAQEDVQKRLYELVQSYVQGDPNERLEPICTTLELETVALCGLMDLENTRKSIRKKNTFQRFRQTKYNLMREESEGFAKLVAELLGDNPIDVTTRNVLALVGYFRLDPNRVFDIILDTVHHSPDRLCQICIKMFVEPSASLKTLEDLISFKLSRVNKIPDSNIRSIIFENIAILLSREIFRVSAVVPHLKLNSFVEHCTQIDETILSTSQKPDSTRSKDKKDEDAFSPASLVIELVAALLRSPNGWKATLDLLDAVEGYERHIFRSQHASLALHAFIQHEIEYVYNKVCAKSSKSTPPSSQLKVDSLNSFAKTICPILTRIGPEAISAHSTKNLALAQRIIRLLKALVATKNNENVSIVHEVLLKTALPAIAWAPGSNPVLALEVWEVIEPMEWTVRFGLYQQWRDSIGQTAIRPELSVAHTNTDYLVRDAMKRFCSEEKLNKFASRKLAKVSHTNPFRAFQIMLSTCQASNNLIPFVTDALVLCGPLGIDVFSFILCDALERSDQEGMIKEDVTHDSLWFSATCQLIGDVFRKCPGMDFTPLLDLVYEKLIRKKEIMFLRVLQVLLTSTTLYEIPSDYSRDLLASAGGGDMLRLLSVSAFSLSPQQISKFTYFSTLREANIARLKKLLEDESNGPFFAKFALAIGVLHKGMFDETRLIFPRDPPAKSLKFKMLLFDQINEIFLVLCHFLATELNQDTLKEHIPPLLDLIKQFKLEVPLAFQLNRLLSKQATATCNEAIPIIFPREASNEDLAAIYTKFWDLSLYDISLPKKLYEEEIKKMDGMRGQLQHSSTITKKMLSKTQEIVTSLKHELVSQTTRFDMIQKLSQEVGSKWREALKADPEVLPNFLQNCLLPRMFLSPDEALFCAKFVQLFFLQQREKMTDFDTLFFQNIFSTVARAVRTTTVRETDCLGVFLTEMLEWIEPFPYLSTTQWRNSLAESIIDAVNQGVPFQALTLLSRTKEVFPDSMDLADKLLSVLDKFELPADDDDQFKEQSFDELEQTNNAGKAAVLAGFIRNRKESGKLRLADGTIPLTALPVQKTMAASAPVVPSASTAAPPVASTTPVALLAAKKPQPNPVPITSLLQLNAEKGQSTGTLQPGGSAVQDEQSQRGNQGGASKTATTPVQSLIPVAEGRAVEQQRNPAQTRPQQQDKTTTASSATDQYRSQKQTRGQSYPPGSGQNQNQQQTKSTSMRSDSGSGNTELPNQNREKQQAKHPEPIGQQPEQHRKGDRQQEQADKQEQQQTGASAQSKDQPARGMGHGQYQNKQHAKQHHQRGHYQQQRDVQQPSTNNDSQDQQHQKPPIPLTSRRRDRSPHNQPQNDNRPTNKRPITEISDHRRDIHRDDGPQQQRHRHPSKSRGGGNNEVKQDESKRGYQYYDNHSSSRHSQQSRMGSQSTSHNAQETHGRDRSRDRGYGNRDNRNRFKRGRNEEPSQTDERKRSRDDNYNHSRDPRYN